MHIHYFQRYHSKENVDTANAMLLLSRLYSYSSTKFFTFLGKILPENAEVELMFNLQEKSKDSIPDATITQSSFKVVIETKLHGDFGLEQLANHLQSFKGEDYKVLLTLDPSQLNPHTKEMLDQKVRTHNLEKNSNVIHRHITFEELVIVVMEVIDERDYEMLDVLEDYKEYCYTSGLIPNDWKRMRVQLAGTTLAINKKLNLYYDSIGRGFSGHDYLGLYSQKAVRAIGKISAIVTALPNNDSLEIKVEKGKLTEDMIARILEAIEDSKQYGYSLSREVARYFFVEKFYDTFYEKETPYAPMGSRMFDLTEVLGIEKLPKTTEIAELLRDKKW
ncbi:hypothetical protein [Dehalobacter sp. TeCB1]|uniref:hypothetical protein n=1 Tax=Dehalobacter sp. TeCB1 TaxID=1843715 RepID=UPI00083B0BE1|nr:hypothetical protein [Dehalobacter sp. TeCB1]OCZ54288.1 hypothetical protein A7D23_05840 [Dehalobacter sp. TeCB1]